MDLQKEISKWVEQTYGSQLEQIKNRMKELSSLPQTYKLKDKVYFKETYIKSKRGLIVSKQYRSARKRKNTLFFPTYELAIEYHKIIPEKIFLIVSNTLDKFIPIQIENQINQFADIKDIKF